MLEKRYAIISGGTSRLSDRLAKALKAIGVTVSFVKYNSGISREYFEKLASRTFNIISKDDSDEIFAFVSIFSFFEAELDIAQETDALFPIATRLQLPSQWRNDLNQVQKIVDRAEEFYLDDENANVHRSRRSLKDKRLLLPVRNCKLPRFRQDLEKIYFGEKTHLSGNISKFITKRRKGEGFRSGRMTFKFARNSLQHPVRRCTDSALCDLKSVIRLGTNIHPSIEFDVTAEGKLCDVEFALCSGKISRAPANADHLNMRINDDWKPGSR